MPFDFGVQEALDLDGSVLLHSDWSWLCGGGEMHPGTVDPYVFHTDGQRRRTSGEEGESPRPRRLCRSDSSSLRDPRVSDLPVSLSDEHFRGLCQRPFPMEPYPCTRTLTWSPGHRPTLS